MYHVSLSNSFWDDDKKHITVTVKIPKANYGRKGSGYVKVLLLTNSVKKKTFGSVAPENIFRLSVISVNCHFG